MTMHRSRTRTVLVESRQGPRCRCLALDVGQVICVEHDVVMRVTALGAVVTQETRSTHLVVTALPHHASVLAGAH